MRTGQWRKSSHCGRNGACVEVADLGGDGYGVRDSTLQGNSPVLAFPRAQWSAFLASARNPDGFEALS